MRRHKLSSLRDWIPVLLCASLVLGVFRRAVVGGVFFFGDIYQLHYPLRTAYAEALRHSELPLWTPHVMAGYPLLAEGQLGALYPPNLLLHALLPVPIALNISILGHFVWAALGAYAFARRLKLLPSAAFCTAVTYALGGFMVAHLNHVNIVAVAAWMPWLFLLTDRLLSAGSTPNRLRGSAFLAGATGLQFLCGHTQMALLSVVAVTSYGLYLWWSADRRLRSLWLLVMSLALGTALAAAQLLPSYELAQASIRSEGLDPSFFVSFSLHPLYLVSLLWPFVLGNPYPNASVELVAYVGWLPLLLAVAGSVLARRRGQHPRPKRPHAFFFAGMAATALVMALGHWNPLYMFLARLPIVNLFRVPSRYLYWFAFAVAVLAGIGLDALQCPAGTRGSVAEDARNWPIVGGASLVALLVVSQAQDADELVAAWRWLPIVLGCLASGWLIWRWLNRKQPQPRRGAFALALVAVDLIAFNGVFNQTYNQTMSQQEFVATPRSLCFLRAQEGDYRILTHEEIVPVLSVMRESFYPNLSLIHGLSSGNGSFPLTLQRYASYVEQMTPRMLDLLGIRHFVIPQVLPVDEASEFYDLWDPFTLDPVGLSVPIEPLQVSAVDLESYLSHSVDWPDGHAVAEIVLHGTEGERETITLHAGWHTSEWAYRRSDVLDTVRHRQATIARSWPARSGFPPEDHPGHTYQASFRLQASFEVKVVEVQPRVPRAFVRIERVVLIEPSGRTHLLSHLAQTGDHTLAYRSEDAAIYVNHDALPRAFVVHDALAMPDDSMTLSQLSDPGFDPGTTVLLDVERVQTAPDGAVDDDSVSVLVDERHQIAMSVRTSQSGYLVLTDTWYPGWKAQVDGLDASLLRANLMFRAVQLEAGEHVVRFTYQPESFRAGCVISTFSLVLLIALAGASGMTTPIRHLVARR